MITHSSIMGALKRTSTQAQHTEITSAATPRSLFEHFLAIRQVDIDRDLAAPLDTRERLSAWQQTRVQCQDGLHQLEAQGLHSILLTTYKLQQEGQVALDDYLFLAAAAANMVASDFIEMALDHPPLKRLGDLLNCFKAREGRANELGWLNGDGPADYEKASGEYSKVVVSLLEAVHTTVFTRYRLTSVLELYESDFIRYELLRSKGLERHRKPLPPSAPVGSQVSETSATTRTFIEQASPVQSRARKIAGHGEDAI